MAHFAFTHKETGEVRFAMSDLDPEHWNKSKALPRAPTAFDEFVDGKLVKNKDREDKVKKASHANSLSREALLDMITALDARITALEATGGI